MDGVVRSLDDVGAHAAGPAAIGFEGLPMPFGGIEGYLPAGYKGFDWTSTYQPGVYSISAFHNIVQAGPLAASGDAALVADSGNTSPLVITKHGGGDFQFTQVDVAAYSLSQNFSGASDVTFTGTEHGTVAGSLTVHADEVHWQTVHANWGAIDTLTVTWTDGGYNAAILDNIWLG